MPLRLIVTLVVLAALAAGGAASAAPVRTAAAAPGLVHRGDRTAISVTAPAKSRSCVASLRFANGIVQQLPARRPVNRKVTFAWRVPLSAALGAGQWSVRCAKVLVDSGVFVVVNVKSTTSADTPRVVVDKQGFSQKPDRVGTGSLISYGLVLRNTSSDQDAEQVYIIVNMVASTGELLGSKSRNVTAIAAGGTFAFGDSMSLRTQMMTAKLEITIRVGAHEPARNTPMPDFANVRVVPSQLEPGWVGEVDGEIVNTVSGKTLQSANLSVVIFDAAGNPIGGGTTMSFASLPSGSRFVFLAQFGFGSVPIDRAASAAISAEPSWVNGG